MSAIAELAKLPAFVRRDLRIAISYRMAAAAGLFGLAANALVFAFIGKLVDPSRLPTFGGTRATYMEFVTIGIALNMVVLLLIHQLATTIRTEQMIGTLESLLVTPTAIGTIQAGSAAFELLYVPIRVGLFVAIIGPALPRQRHPAFDRHSGRLPALPVGTRAAERRRDPDLPAGRGRLDGGRDRARLGVGRVFPTLVAASLAAEDRQRQPACDRDS